MGKLVFRDLTALKRIVEHSQKAQSWQKSYDGKEMRNTFCLVHDDGVYIMSAAQPRDLIKAKSPNGLHDIETSFVTHAERCDPKKDPDDFWENSRELVGGDDFVEYLPLEWLQKTVEASNGSLIINVSANEITASIPMPRKPQPTPDGMGDPPKKKPPKKSPKRKTPTALKGLRPGELELLTGG